MRLRTLLFAGTMAGLAVLLQTAPIWFGQPAGFLLAILASLPMAITAAVENRSASLALLVAAFLCALFQPEEGWVFGLTNGPFGISLGVTVRNRYGGWKAIIPPALALFMGMTLLTWGVGFAALGPELLGLGLPIALGIYALFALLWSIVFTPIARTVIRRTLSVMDRWVGFGPPR